MVGWKPFSKKSVSERRSNISPEICLISRAPNRRAEWELKYSLYSVCQALPSCGAAAGIPEQGGPISFNNLLRYYSRTRKCSILRCTVQWVLYFTELSKDHHYPIIQYFHHHPIIVVVWSPSCAWLCDPMDGSTPDLPVPHHLPEFAQVHAHYISNAVQPSHPLMPSSPSALNLPQHQEFFQWVVCPHQMTKILELQLQHQSFQWIFRVDLP